MGVTSIAWTRFTFNAWWGCTRVSPGCDHCYAEAWDQRWNGNHWGKGQPRRTFGPKHWNQLFRWNRLAESEGSPSLVFCASMADVMDDEAPEGEFERLCGIINQTPYLTYQMLTKRPHRYQRRLPRNFPLRNVWLGTTAEDQKYYDLRWDILRRLRDIDAFEGFPLWISYEPALGPLSIRKTVDKPDWIICGGESGANHRLMEQKWAEALLDECRAFGVAFFMKQMSAPTPRAGKKWIPPHLFVREYPNGFHSTTNQEEEKEELLPVIA